MDMTLPVLLAALVAGYALVGGRLDRTPVTMPLVFLAAGLLAGFGGLAGPGAPDLLLPVAEATLALLLFADAAALSPRMLRRESGLSMRLLLLGMPLSFVIGAAAIWLLLPGWPLLAILLLAALLVPTDAALGQSVLSNRAFPEKLRAGLNVESGLNDGLALPAILILAGAAAGGTDDRLGMVWWLFVTLQIGGGILFGVTLGWLGGALLSRARAAGWATAEGAGIAVLALVGLLYLGAQATGANGFVAAFTGGVAFAGAARAPIRSAKEFAETDGQLLAMLSFLAIGALLGPDALATIDWRGAAVVVAALFVIRPLAVWLALGRSHLSTGDRLFLGWFGPRGLATAIFAVMITAEFDGLPQAGALLAIAVVAVLASAVLHGVSAHFAPRMGIFHVGRAR